MQSAFFTRTFASWTFWIASICQPSATSCILSEASCARSAACWACSAACWAARAIAARWLAWASRAATCWRASDTRRSCSADSRARQKPGQYAPRANKPHHRPQEHQGPGAPHQRPTGRHQPPIALVIAYHPPLIGHRLPQQQYKTQHQHACQGLHDLLDHRLPSLSTLYSHPHPS